MKAPIPLLLVCALVLPGCGSDAKPSTSPGTAAKPADKVEAALPSTAAQTAALRRFSDKGLPIYCAGKAKPWVALTFDDGPGTYTRHALTLLNRAGLRRTFFDVGRNVKRDPTSVKREQRSGSAIGNHSWSHPVLPSLSNSRQRAQIADTNRAITRITGQPVRLFRPPYAERDAVTDRIVRSLGMVTILWDVDSRDSLGASSKTIARRVKAGLHPGAIVLMHENHGQTVRALRYTILPALKKSGLTAVTVPEMLAGNPPSDAQLKKGRDGCPKRN